MKRVSVRVICLGACPCLVINFLPEGYYGMEKLLVDLFKALIPDVLNPAKHTGLSFICSMFGIAFYGNLMLNDDDVDDWKKGLLWTVVCANIIGHVKNGATGTIISEHKIVGDLIWFRIKWDEKAEGSCRLNAENLCIGWSAAVSAKDNRLLNEIGH